MYLLCLYTSAYNCTYTKLWGALVLDVGLSNSLCWCYLAYVYFTPIALLFYPTSQTLTRWPLVIMPLKTLETVRKVRKVSVDGEVGPVSYRCQKEFQSSNF